MIGHSYHLMVTALAFGVPVFSIADMSTGKYTAFRNSNPYTDLRGKLILNGSPANWEKTAPSKEALEALDRLSTHWDRTASAIREGSPCRGQTAS